MIKVSDCVTVEKCFLVRLRTNVNKNDNVQSVALNQEQHAGDYPLTERVG